MPLPQRAAPDFDLSIFRRASTDFLKLTDKLPPDAVAALAQEVVARLAQRRPEGVASGLAAPGEQEIHALCMALVGPDPEAGARAVAEIRSAGVSVADVYLNYLSGAADLMGELWKSNSLSFVDVTIGTSRILGILRSLKSMMSVDDDEIHPVAVFAAVPGEQHIIGVTMAADLFRRDGWEIELRVGDSHDELVDFIGGAGFRIVGLSSHGRESIPALVRLISAIRVSSPAASIMVSGNVVDQASDIIDLTGADGFANDVDSARRVLDGFRRKNAV
jgi:methanogenic corrinoid protein MtbC1